MVGPYVLVPGDPAGAVIAPATGQAVAGENEQRALAKAIAQARREREPALTDVASLEDDIGDASQVLGKMERAAGLVTEVVQGRLDPASISDEVDVLLGLLARLDRDERWGEALRVARCLATLLALLGRWVELLRSLRVALSAAEQLGDAGGEAWALHELGTLHLAAEKHAEADRLLGRAHDLRERAGDRHGLATTDRNLQILCRTLRAQIDDWPRWDLLKRILRRPVPALVFAVLLLVVGGVAGAVVRGAVTGRGAPAVVTNANAQTNTTNTSKTNTSKTNTGTTNTSTHTATITSGDSATFVEGTEGSFTVTARGVPSPTITQAGRLPDGVRFSGGVLSGIPTVTGSFPISFTATNSVGSSVQSFTLTVDSEPAITSASETTFAPETAGSFTVTATGSPAPTITEAGALPDGVTFSGGVLSGTTTLRGTYPITFTAANGVGSDAVQSFTLTVERDD